jgi:hypothetical protein
VPSGPGCAPGQARIGFFATPQIEVGALFNLQSTTMQISGPGSTFDLGAIAVRQSRARP